MNRRTIDIAAHTLALMLIPTLAFAAGGHGDGFPWVAWAVSMVNFAIFAGLIVWKLGPVIQQHFKDRAEGIKTDIEEAKRLRTEAAERLEEYSTKLEKLDEEREALLNEYKELGEREKKRIIADANKHAEKMRADAEVVIQQEVRKAVAALEQEAVELAVQMARESLQTKVNDRTQNALVDSFVTDLKSLEGQP